MSTKSFIRSLFVFLVVGTLASSVSAQETLFSNVHSGVFIEPMVGAGAMKGTVAVAPGARLGWVLNNSLVLGIGGTGIMSTNSVWSSGDTSEYAMVGYGGLVAEYMFMADHAIHPTLSVLVGGGLAGTQRWSPRPSFYSDTIWYGPSGSSNQHFGHQSSAIFVVEPQFSVEFNLVSFVRLDLNVSYRYVSNFTQPAYTNKDLSGISGGLGFKVGWF